MNYQGGCAIGAAPCVFRTAAEGSYIDEIVEQSCSSSGQLDPGAGCDFDEFGWDVHPRSEIYDGCKRRDTLLNVLKDKVISDTGVRGCVRILVAYYKYFSQYEHYSECGKGDSAAPFGRDNIRYEKVFDHLD